MTWVNGRVAATDLIWINLLRCAVAYKHGDGYGVHRRVGNVNGRVRRAWNWLCKPSAGITTGSLLSIGVVVAGIAWGGFSSFLDHSNSLEFCISCHEMRDYVYREYQESPHYQNAAGVRAICADCHVPRAFGPKMVRKIIATFNEVPKHLMGTIDTREKFEARRLTLAEHVWSEMRANDSLACRGCHSREAMVLADQRPRARGQHEEALTSGETCIDCHQGIAHRLPEGFKQDHPETEDFAL